MIFISHKVERNAKKNLKHQEVSLLNWSSDLCVDYLVELEEVIQTLLLAGIIFFTETSFSFFIIKRCQGRSMRQSIIDFQQRKTMLIILRRIQSLL